MRLAIFDREPDLDALHRIRGARGLHDHARDERHPQRRGGARRGAPG
jgi:hypothetical protein